MSREAAVSCGLNCCRSVDFNTAILQQLLCLLKGTMLALLPTALVVVALNGQQELEKGT